MKTNLLINSCPEMEENLVLHPVSSNENRRRRFLSLKKDRKHSLYEIEKAVVLSTLYKISEEEVVKVTEALKAVLELYTIFGLADPRSQAWIRKNIRQMPDHLFIKRVASNQVYYKAVHQLLNFCSVNGEGSWVKLLKWKFASFFSFYRKEEIPEMPLFVYPTSSRGYRKGFFQPEILLPGWLHERFCNLSKKQKFRFIDTTQQLKKAMPDVPISMVEKSVKDTVKDLTSCPKQVADSRLIIEIGTVMDVKFEVPLDFQRVKVEMELRRTVSELFENERISCEEIYEPFFPSTSANYIWSRAKCGALSELYDRLSFGKEGDCLNFGSQMCSLSVPVSEHFGEVGRHEQYKMEMYEEAGDHQTDLCPVLLADHSSLMTKWKEQYLKMVILAKDEIPRVAAVGLPEPLKVRVISKGPPLLYTVLKPFQKWMWKVLKRNKVFSLIGRYVTEDDINRVLGQLAEHEIALSGDYIASTNNLHSWVSEVILDQLLTELGQNMSKDDLENLPSNFMSQLRLFFLNALTKHVFVEDGVELPQKEGQLMGSIISFPFLCIANAALCRMSLEESDLMSVKFRLSDRPYPGSGKVAPLLVNGDDCLLRGHFKRLRPSWEGNCAIAGLYSSMGKTYYSHDFCTINSTIFEWKDGSWTEQKYVNLGLMMGKKRMGAGGKVNFNPQVGIHQLGTICRELKRSCPTDLWPIVKSRFIYYNMNTLSAFPGLPWFLPEWLGGIGLPVDNPSEISDEDRRVATIIKNGMNNDRELKPVKPKDMNTWLMHQRVEKDLKSLGAVIKPHYRKGLINGQEFDLEEQYSKLYKLMTINLLEKEPLESLFEIVKEDKNVSKALWHNVDVFKKARTLLRNSIEPMSDTDMLYENKDLVVPCFVGYFPTFEGLLPEIDCSL